MPSVRCAVAGFQVNKPAHCFTVKGKQLPRVRNATPRRNADARVRRSLLRRAGAMLACARARVAALAASPHGGRAGARARGSDAS